MRRNWPEDLILAVSDDMINKILSTSLLEGGPESEISGSLKNLKPEKIGL